LIASFKNAPPTPRAAVANNDQAIGMIVERLSHSPYWKETAIFIIEDDAQDGADHVDAHRTAGLVISPFVRRETVDSSLYTTSSMVRTIELLLGLPPMTQYDAAANPMYKTFSARADLTPYTLRVLFTFFVVSMTGFQTSPCCRHSP
jgi:hypothetical protein